MRLVLYLGTRGCPGVLEAALREYLEPVEVLVPVEPRLLGPELSDAGLGDGLDDVAQVLRDRASSRALALAERGEGELSGVFGEDPDAGDRVDARVLEPPIEDALSRVVDESDAEACYVARDALDVLDDAGIRLEGVLDEREVDLVTR